MDPEIDLRRKKRREEGLLGGKSGKLFDALFLYPGTIVFLPLLHSDVFT